MSIAPGVRLGPYEIVAPLGAGGMGEVYRARDTRLDRTVAIKVLPPQLAADPQLRERFEREARAISSLQHPHICALFDVGRDGDHEFLVLEYLEGETLADRIGRAGALAVADALKVATEICGALDKAHRSGIVHRDLKPANVMLTKAGAKLLDFGLAKAAAPAVATPGLSMAATTPPNVTAQGTLLGTFQYMAPEQIEGLDADARTDIFALGALLFEMLTGRTAFEGKTRASLLGAILKDEPPRVSTVKPLSPPALDRIIATCLAKDPGDRYQSARDLLRDLGWVASPDAARATPEPEGRCFGGGALALAALLAVAVGALGAIVVRHLREPAASTDSIQFAFAPPRDASFATPLGGGTGLATQLAVSPDSRFVVFVANNQDGFQLWLRSLNALDARPLPGTEDGAFPFWSPDGHYIGFFAGGKLKKVNATGGPPVVLCDAPSARGGTWNGDNVIVFAPSTTGALQRVSSAGGSPEPASSLDAAYGETNDRFPSFLPDGRHFFYTGVIGTCCPASKPARIRIGTLGSLEATTLLQVESSAQFAAGHVLFDRDGTLMALPFDATTRQPTGDAFPITEGVGSEGSRYASFSVAGNVLAYARGVVRATTRLTWFDRTGRTLGTIGEAAAYLGASLSSDGRRVAVVLSSGSPANRDVWIIDASRGTPRRFTFDPGDDNSPIWSPDDSRIVFLGNRGASSSLLVKRVDDAATEVDLPVAGLVGVASPSDWSADGRFLVFTRGQGMGGSPDVWVLPLFGDRKPIAIAQTPSFEVNGVMAPNGRWIAYQSNETGIGEIFVQPFPPSGGRFQISRTGGIQPQWSTDGKEIFFLSPDSKLMAVTVDTDGPFQFASPAALFSVNTVGASYPIGRQFGVTKDGRRFLVNVMQQQVATIPITVVVNWISSVQK
jgi:Tol biopolymer transport system component